MMRFTIKQMFVATSVIAVITAVLLYLWPDRTYYGKLIGWTCIVAILLKPLAVVLIANKRAQKWNLHSRAHLTCIATDHITAYGFRVGYLYREHPDGDWDSGWRFFSGRESDEYADNPAGIAVHDVNTIASFDSTIIPLLESPVGSAFARDERTGQFDELAWSSTQQNRAFEKR